VCSLRQIGSQIAYAAEAVDILDRLGSVVLLSINHGNGEIGAQVIDKDGAAELLVQWWQWRGGQRD